MNRIILMGRLTADPDIRECNNGTLVANYSLAVNRYGTEDTDFFRCSAFNKGAEFAEKYLHKGMKIAIEGSVQLGSYTDKEGTKVNTCNVIVNSHEFCESKREDTSNEQNRKGRSSRR